MMRFPRSKERGFIEAVQEFLDGGGELVDQRVAVSQPERPTPQKQAERASAKAHERAKKKLAAAGIL